MIQAYQEAGVEVRKAPDALRNEYLRCGIRRPANACDRRQGFGSAFLMGGKARKMWQARTDVADFVLPGTISDDWKCERNMHASHGAVEEGMPVRSVGNTVFPNGFLEFDLAGQGSRIGLHGQGRLRIEVNGKTFESSMCAGEESVIAVPAAGDGRYHCRLTKVGGDYPWILGVSLLK